MCLAIPRKLVEIALDAQGVRMGRAKFGGIVKQVCLEPPNDGGISLGQIFATTMFENPQPAGTS